MLRATKLLKPKRKTRSQQMLSRSVDQLCLLTSNTLEYSIAEQHV